MSGVDSIRFSKNNSNFNSEIIVQNNEGRYKTTNYLDPNVYATKKTIAQGIVSKKLCFPFSAIYLFKGMLDVALLTANASQLKYCLQLGKKHQFFYLMVSLISTSIVLQVIVGAIFVLVGYINFNDENTQRRLNIMNNIATVFVFVITVVNVLIAGFGLNFDDSVVKNK